MPTEKPLKLTTVTEFKREVNRQIRARFRLSVSEWDWAKRGTFPTGMPCITGEGRLSNGQKFLAVYSAPTDAKHTLDVREIS